MTIHCPKCQSRFSVEDAELGRQAGARFRCKKCQAVFPAQGPSETEAATSRPVPTQQYGEFHKKFQNPEPPAPLDATSLRPAARPFLDKANVVSLVAIDGPMKGQTFPVVKPSVLLGRSETDIVLEDSNVSRRHCTLEVHGATAVLSDLGSTNGTYVDDQRIETHLLEHLGEFRVGASTLVFSVRPKEQ